LERQVNYQNTVNSSLDIQQNFVGDFKIGGFRNRLVAGVDVLSMRVNNDNSPYIVFDFVNGKKNDDKNYVKISKYAVDAKISASTLAPTRNHSLTNIYSAYASDVFNVTDRLIAMLSLRVDKYDSKGTINHATNTEVANSKYEQTAWSPKLGLVYQVVKNKVSLFANYMNGFSNIAPVTQPLADISGIFKPMQANQYEGGLKLDVLQNRLSLTASYYDITVKNVTRVDVVERNATQYNITVQNGTQNSKGFEVELIASPINGLNVIAGYGHNDSKLIKSTAALEGRRPVDAGPADLVNAWISYTQPKGKLKGLGLGLGGNYVTRFLTSNSATTGEFAFSAYTLFNSTLFYEAGRYRLGFKVENLFDEKYYVGQGVVAAQMPRNYTASVSVRF
jgi:iron complex outermembrane receptor protein